METSQSLYDPLTLTEVHRAVMLPESGDKQTEALANVIKTCKHLVAICELLEARMVALERYVDNLKRGRNVE